MSDPVSNEDIEGVLSSIRRLVSDEPTKGTPRRKFASVDNVERFVLTPAFRVAEEDLAPQTADPALNLQEDQGDMVTADYRPAQDMAASSEDETAWHTPSEEEIALQPYQSDSEWTEPKPEQNDRLTGETSDDSEPDHHDSEPCDLDPLYLEPAANQDVAPPVHGQSVAEPGGNDEGAQVAQADGDLENIASEDDFWQDSPQHDHDPEPRQDNSAEGASDVDIDALFQDETPEIAAPDAETNTSETDERQPDSASVQGQVAGQVTLEQRIAELEAALQNSTQEWEPDGSEEELTDETRPLAFGKDARLADAITSVAQTLEKSAPEQDEKWQPSAQTAGPAPIESLYADARSDTAEDDVELDDDTFEWQDVEQDWDPDSDADVSFATEDDAKTDATAQKSAMMQAAALAAAQDAADTDRDTDLFAADEPTMLDEEALQELVADIVRQELQGVLGERITRNVRRLVRREIKRALAMRDLE